MIAEVSRRVTSDEFIGRSGELAQISGILDEATRGIPSHLLLGGEAGIGKTRLVGEAAEMARVSGWTVLTGACLDLGETGLPFEPFVDLLRRWVRDVGRPQAIAFAGPMASDLGRLLPELAPRPPTPAQGLSAEGRIHEALFELLTTIARRGPVLAIVEDIHWADPSSLAVLAFLLRAASDIRLTVLATYRTDELHRRHPLRRWLGEALRHGRLTRVELAPFSEDEMAALIGNVIGQPASVDLARRILLRSDGNPFFAEELLASGIDDAAPSLSPTLRDLLLARIAGVSPAGRRALDTVAVAGCKVTHSVLASLFAPDGIDPTPAIRESVDAGLLVAFATPEDAYAFRHELVAEAAYEDVLPAERRRLHRAYALALEASADGTHDARRLVELAHHWRAARDVPRAFSASVRAGDAAAGTYAFTEALSEYEHALAAWDQVTDADELAGMDRIELLRRAARAADLASAHRQAVGLLREALTLAEEGPALRTGALLEQFGRSLWIQGDTAAAVDAYERALAITPAAPPSTERARAVSGLAQVYMLHGWLRKSLELTREAVDEARRAGARGVEGHALNTMGTDLAAIGDGAGAIRTLERALEDRTRGP